MKLLESTENKITEDKNSEITEQYQFIVTWSIMIINMIQEYCTLLFQINRIIYFPYKSYLSKNVQFGI